MSSERKSVNTTLNEDLYTQIRIIALHKKVNANDLIEEGMIYVINNFKENDSNKNLKGEQNE